MFESCRAHCSHFRPGMEISPRGMEILDFPPSNRSLGVSERARAKPALATRNGSR
jgi:hypothetical protein